MHLLMAWESSLAVYQPGRALPMLYIIQHAKFAACFAGLQQHQHCATSFPGTITPVLLALVARMCLSTRILSSRTCITGVVLAALLLIVLIAHSLKRAALASLLAFWSSTQCKMIVICALFSWSLYGIHWCASLLKRTGGMQCSIVLAQCLCTAAAAPISKFLEHAGPMQHQNITNTTVHKSTNRNFSERLSLCSRAKVLYIFKLAADWRLSGWQCIPSDASVCTSYRLYRVIEVASLQRSSEELHRQCCSLCCGHCIASSTSASCCGQSTAAVVQATPLSTHFYCNCCCTTMPRSRKRMHKHMRTATLAASMVVIPVGH